MFSKAKGAAHSVVETLMRLAIMWWVEHSGIWDGLLEVEVLHQLSSPLLGANNLVDWNTVLGDGDVGSKVGIVELEDVCLQFAVCVRKVKLHEPIPSNGNHVHKGGVRGDAPAIHF